MSPLVWPNCPTPTEAFARMGSMESTRTRDEMAVSLSARSHRRKGTNKRFDVRSKTDVNAWRGNAPRLNRSFGSLSGSPPRNGV